MGPIVNRDLSRRIRTVNGITVDKKVVRNDIKLAAKVITNLDTRWQLWNAGETNGKSENLEQVDYFLSYKFVFMPALLMENKHTFLMLNGTLCLLGN